MAVSLLLGWKEKREGLERDKWEDERVEGEQGRDECWRRRVAADLKNVAQVHQEMKHDDVK